MLLRQSLCRRVSGFVEFRRYLSLYGGGSEHTTVPVGLRTVRDRAREPPCVVSREFSLYGNRRVRRGVRASMRETTRHVLVVVNEHYDTTAFCLCLFHQQKLPNDTL